MPSIWQKQVTTAWIILPKPGNISRQGSELLSEVPYQKPKQRPYVSLQRTTGLVMQGRHWQVLNKRCGFMWIRCISQWSFKRGNLKGWLWQTEGNDMRRLSSGAALMGSESVCGSFSFNWAHSIPALVSMCIYPTSVSRRGHLHGRRSYHLYSHE